MKTPYRILSWRSANKMKDAKSVNFLMQIEYNLSRVYLLSNWSYLIMPVNPFGNSLLTKRQDLMQKWIKERWFPAADEVGKLYINHRERMEDLMANKEGLKNTLCEYVFKREMRSPSCLSAQEIDDVYEILKKKKLYERFKLHFVVLLGDYLISHQEEMNWRWGLLRMRQYLNPVTSLILVADENRSSYYSLEDSLAKRGYAGVNHYMKAIWKGAPSRVNELAEIARVMEPEPVHS